MNEIKDLWRQMFLANSRKTYSRKARFTFWSLVLNHSKDCFDLNLQVKFKIVVWWQTKKSDSIFWELRFPQEVYLKKYILRFQLLVFLKINSKISIFHKVISTTLDPIFAENKSTIIFYGKLKVRLYVPENILRINLSIFCWN